jgi:hypothetical protein
MIRLEKHDEIVEAIQQRIMSELFGLCQPGRGDVFSFIDDHRNFLSAAALDAMLEAVVRLEVGEVSDVVSGPKSYVALFLRMEDSDDK